MRIISAIIVIMTIGLLGLMGCAGDRPQNLGIQKGALASCPSSPNCFSSQADDDAHQIEPLTFTTAPDVAFTRLKHILGRRSDTTVVEENVGYLRVELRTRLFVDDCEFLLDREKGVIHIRSASRLGYSDLGKNRSRLEEIRSQFLAQKSKSPL